MKIDLLKKLSPDDVFPRVLNASSLVEETTGHSTGQGCMKKLFAWTPGLLGTDDLRPGEQPWEDVQVDLPPLHQKVILDSRTDTFKTDGKFHWAAPFDWDETSPWRDSKGWDSADLYDASVEAIWIGWRYRVLSVEAGHIRCGVAGQRKKSQCNGIARIAARWDFEDEWMHQSHLHFNCHGWRGRELNLRRPCRSFVTRNSWLPRHAVDCDVEGIITRGPLKGEKTLLKFTTVLPVTVEIEFEFLSIFGRELLNGS